MSHVLEARYDEYSRSLEIHAVGYNKNNEAIMRVWQVSGGSSSNERIGWKLMFLKDIRAATVTDEESLAPRTGFKRGDSAMMRILCQV